MVYTAKSISRRHFCWFATKLLPFWAVLAACHKTDETSSVTDRKVKLCPLSQLKNGKTPFGVEGLLLIRLKNEIGAMTLTCTHQRCALKINVGSESEASLVCPCHGSLFSDRGDVIRGPATEPLAWYELSLDDNQMIEVNLAKRVNPEWRLKV